MGDTPSTVDRMLSIFVAAATAVMVVLNLLARLGHINGVTTIEVSNKYPSVLTPAGFTFAVWVLIYLGLVAFSIYQLFPSRSAGLRPVRKLYVISSVLNCLWLFLWHSHYIGVCLVVMVALLVTLAAINIRLRNAETVREALFTKAPLGLYFGWITVASIINFVVYLRSADVQMSALAWNILGCSLIAVVLVLAVIVRVRLRNFLYPLAVAWVATGIAIEQQGNTAIILACAICVIFCLVLSISFVMDLKSTNHE